MKSQTFEDKLQQLIIDISALSKEQREELISSICTTKDNRKTIKASVNNIVDSLTDLLILHKYLLFDKEATVRERDHLKAQLSDNDPD